MHARTSTDAAAEPAGPMGEPAVALSGRQRRYLKGLAQRLEASVWVGEAGLSDGVRRALDEALGARELVKVRMRQPEDKKALAVAMARSVHAALVGVVGHTAILYRARSDEPRIELPV